MWGERIRTHWTGQSGKIILNTITANQMMGKARSEEVQVLQRTPSNVLFVLRPELGSIQIPELNWLNQVQLEIHCTLKLASFELGSELRSTELDSEFHFTEFKCDTKCLISYS